MSSERWDTLAQWFSEWLAADLDGRAQLRARLASERPELLAEADRLVGSSAGLDGFLEAPALVVTASELASEDSLLAASSMIGPYEIAGLLARGGMGDVYRATDTRLRRPVAIKLLSQTRTGDPLRVERFMQEARVTASLNHPNIVRVYDVGSFAGRAYLVAELLEGETLRERISRGPLPADDVVRIGVAIAHGLSAAHAAGLVHRDLKPENTFLTVSGATKLLDFGIAKLAQDETVRDGFSTLTGIVLGTAGYLAPEQIRGERVDARADLFALGVVLFEMLTSVRAFARDHIVDTLHAILHEPPSSALEDRDDVPSGLAGIVARLLEKSPDARFGSAADVIAALETIVSTEIAGPRTTAPSGSEVARTLAVMPFRIIPAEHGNDLLELGLADIFISRLGQLTDVRVLPLSATERVRGENPVRAARQLGANRVLAGTLQCDSGEVRAVVQLLSTLDERTVWSTTVDTDARSIFAIQDIIVTKVIEELAPRLSPRERSRLAKPGTHHADAYEAYLQGRTLVARPTRTDLLRAAELFEQAISIDPAYADAWAGLGSAHKRLTIVADARPMEAFGKARHAAERALELDERHPEAYSVLGTVAFWHDWDYARAEQLLRHALALQPGAPDAQVFLAHLLSNIGRHDEALVEIRRARALDPAWHVPRTLEGQFLFMARRYEDSLRHLDAFVTVAPQFWTAHVFRVFPLLHYGRFDDAIAECDTIRELQYRMNPDAPQLSFPRALNGVALARRELVDAAEALLAELRTDARDRYVPPHHEALILHALGRDDEALDALERAVDVRDVFVTFLAVDPKWDALRHMPRFQAVLRRVNLPALTSTT